MELQHVCNGERIETEAIFEEILAKNILNQIKDIQPLIQEAMQIPSRINIKKTTPR